MPDGGNKNTADPMNQQSLSKDYRAMDNQNDSAANGTTTAAGKEQDEDGIYENMIFPS